MVALTNYYYLICLQLFVNERGMLMALLKLVLCFTKKNKFIDKHNLLANNFEIQLQLIAGILILILYFR